MILLDWARTSNKCDSRFSEINIRSVNAGIASENGVSNMQMIMTYLNLPMSVATGSCNNRILNNIVQSSMEIAGESTDKASRNLISMCRSDDQNNEIYPENYKSDVKNSVPVAAVTIDVAW